MMTEKLYYNDPYLREFDATVTGCDPVIDGYQVTLDRTAFYPEGGGQPADTGLLGGVKVLDVHEKDGKLLHSTQQPLAVGEKVRGVLDWERRFTFMQNHTGEHIASGLIHELFGLDNVGFHLGRDAVTIDFNGELTADNLRQVELLANRAVWDNRPVAADYPDADALAALDYRSKKELSGAVRIVTVPGCDVCACCGTHLRTTGEVGAVKLLHFQRYKGGVRIWMQCGADALADYARKNDDVYALSELLSAKPEEIVPAVKRLLEEQESSRQKLSAMQNELFKYRALEVEEGATTACLFETGMQPGELRRFCLTLCGRCTVAAVFSGSDEDGWKYAVGSDTEDVRQLGKDLNAAFSGRGGGNKELVQGSLTGTREDIDQFFRSRV